MITQYTESYNFPSADIQNIIANKCSLLDEFIIMQTGQYEYSALINNAVTKKCTKYVISRNNSNYSSNYTVKSSDSTFDYNVTNEYYVCSNVGLGKSVSMPVYQGVISYSLVTICVMMCFVVVFKGALFKIFNRK